MYLYIGKLQILQANSSLRTHVQHKVTQRTMANQRQVELLLEIYDVENISHCLATTSIRLCISCLGLVLLQGGNLLVSFDPNF